MKVSGRNWFLCFDYARYVDEACADARPTCRRGNATGGPNSWQRFDIASPRIPYRIMAKYPQAAVASDAARLLGSKPNAAPRVFLDAVPEYLASSVAPPRAAALLPHAKFVVVLRVRRLCCAPLDVL